MTTSANAPRSESSHWYYPDGRPCYEVPKASGKPGEMRAATLADARKLNLLPGVTTILKILHKEALVNWLCEQACLAVLTTPRTEQESLDQFVERVLKTERVQDQESQVARDRGTQIHDALDAYFQGRPVDDEIKPWIMPAALAIAARGELVATEKVLVGDGYAGRTDLIQRTENDWWLWDWKSAKKLPDPKKGGAWKEHVLQAAAYANAYGLLIDQDSSGEQIGIRTGNVYISTLEQGRFVICEHDTWGAAYAYGFAPLLTHWQWANNYKPEPLKALVA